MKSIHSVIVSAVLSLFALGTGQASQRPHDYPNAAKAEMTLQQINDWARSVEATADTLSTTDTLVIDPQLIGDQLNSMVDDVNHIVRDLRSLDAERQSMAAWESSAIDEAAPKVQEIAATLTKTLQIYTALAAESQRVHGRDPPRQHSPEAEPAQRARTDPLRRPQGHHLLSVAFR